MREIRPSGSEGGAGFNPWSLPLSTPNTPPLQHSTTPAFERWLRLWPVNESGQITWDHNAATRLEATRHLVYRGHLLTGFRDNWGGPMRAVLGWWLLRGLAREWWGRFQERYGSPFPVGKTNMQDAGAVAFLQEAFSLSTKIGGMVIGQDDTVELIQAANTGGAEGYRLWQQTCNDAISRAITGIEPSANPAGLNAGQSNKAENVREDVRMFDQLKLGQALERQLFAQFLQINGLPGRVKLSFGGLSDADAATFAGTLNTLSQAGFEPEDAALPTLNERLGMAVRRKAAPPPLSLTGPTGPTGPTEDAEDAEDPEEPEAPETPDPAEKPATLSAQAGAAQALGVPPGWLNPVAEFLKELERKAADQTLSDTDLLAFLEKARDRVPELFNRMDVAELSRVLETGMGQAVMDGVRLKLRQEPSRNSETQKSAVPTGF